MTGKRDIIQVSAPGNVMLMGEHAVLFGYRAIVCAVAQRIHVTLTPRDDACVSIQSALADYSGTLPAIKALNIAEQSAPPELSKLSFVLAAIRAVNPACGFDLSITSEFSHTVGLGSSAAVTAATVAALIQYRQPCQRGDFSHAVPDAHSLDSHTLDANSPDTQTLDTIFDIGLSAIHAVQGRGSGSDLAASVFGGMVGYTATPRRIEQLFDTDQLSAHELPSLDLFYCGYKTPTPAVLAMVEQASQTFPELYGAIYQQMHQVTTAAEAAIKQREWNKLGKLMNIYHGLMDALGVSDAKLSELVYQARQHHGVLGAKISGSGLGDCIITLSDTHAVSTTSDKTYIGAHIEANISPRGVLKVGGVECAG